MAGLQEDLKEKSKEVAIEKVETDKLIKVVGEKSANAEIEQTEAQKSEDECTKITTEALKVEKAAIEANSKA